LTRALGYRSRWSGRRRSASCPWWFALSTLAVCGALGACTQAAPEPPAPSFDSPATYFSTARTLSVEVFYEPTAEPYVGQITSAAPQPFGSLPFWEMTRKNLETLFESRPTSMTVKVPTALEAMTALPPQERSGWDTGAIRALAEAVRKHTPTATDAGLVVLFLSGSYEKAGQPRPDVLGVNVGQSPFVAIFKDAIRSTSPNPASELNLIPVFAEQVTVVHETAHALGLVNNGVPLTSEHQDLDHGRHCLNPSCIMSHLNEGKDTGRAFIDASIEEARIGWFGPECLADTKAYAP
jgi:hypothetical protein